MANDRQKNILTKEFVRMGMEELSVSPASILPLRKKSAVCNFYSYSYFYITHENTPDNASAVSGAAFGVNALLLLYAEPVLVAGSFLYTKDYFLSEKQKTPQSLAVSISKW